MFLNVDQRAFIWRSCIAAHAGENKNSFRHARAQPFEERRRFRLRAPRFGGLKPVP